MMYRMFPLAALALALFVGASTMAAQAPGDSTQEGKVVSIAGDKLVMTGKDGKESTYTLAADAKVSCDSTACKVVDLKPGMKIRVTTTKDDKAAVSRIEALDKNADFEKPAIELKP